MTATLTTTVDRTPTAVGVDEIRDVTNRLLRTIAACDPDDRRWERAGQLVTAAAARLREAIGTASVASGGDAPPIVRERDLATAAHRLLASDARVVDVRAAHQFVRLSMDAALALS